MAGNSKPGSSSGYWRTLLPVAQRMTWPRGASRKSSVIMWNRVVLCCKFFVDEVKVRNI